MTKPKRRRDDDTPSMTIPEVAEMFAVSERTIIRWMQTMRLPHYKLGGTTRFRRSELEAWAQGFATGEGRSDG